MKKAILTTLLALTIGFTTATVFAMNLLTNPDFETGDLTGWLLFGNAFHSTETGVNAAKLFGTFNGSFNVTGMFQQFPAAPGDEFLLDADSFHLASDPMIGAGAPDDNWVVMKIAFFDAGGNEITPGAEATILDANSPTDVWIDNPPVTGIAPANTASVQALILYLQPAFDGGAAHVDNVVFQQIDATAVTMQAAQSDTVSTSAPLLTIVLFAVLTATTLVISRKRNALPL